MTLEDALACVSVHHPGSWGNELTPWLGDWWAVSNEKEGGIVAYFYDERTAYRFRLAEINRLLTRRGRTQ